MKKNFINGTLFILTVLLFIGIPSYATTNYDIKEIENEDGSITRTYERNNDYTRAITVLSKEERLENIKDLLISLGRDEEIIDEFSEEELLRYENCLKLNATVSYIKSDEQGNTVNVSEEEALKNSKSINDDFNRIMKDYFLEKNRLSIKNLFNSLRGQDTYKDKYMRVFHLVTQLSDEGEYLFETDARWLVMPWWRNIDSIGSCADYIRIDYDSASGWYKYKLRTYSDWDSDSEWIEEYLDNDDFEGASKGVYKGVAALLDLPENVYSDDTSELCSNYKVHVEYEGIISEPDNNINFNSNGTYDHMIYKINYTPSISIGNSKFGLSIGLDVDEDHEERTAHVSESYSPK